MGLEWKTEISVVGVIELASNYNSEAGEYIGIAVSKVPSHKLARKPTYSHQFSRSAFQPTPSSISIGCLYKVLLVSKEPYLENRP